LLIAAICSGDADADMRPAITVVGSPGMRRGTRKLIVIAAHAATT
jgi:hypothetical protein